VLLRLKMPTSRTMMTIMTSASIIAFPVNYAPR
jgi:hypothetical protein